MLVEKKRRDAAWSEWHDRDPRGAREGAEAAYARADMRGTTSDGFIPQGILRAIKGRALAKGIAFDLKRTDLPLPERCEILGIPLFYSGSKTDNTPEVDRVCPKLGYVRGNVRIISSRANRLKQDASLEEARAIVAYLERHGST